VKILIANRGEIAVRIIRACREMGIPTVAVYSDCDRQARHVREADQAFHIGPSEAAQSYLRIDRILEVARAPAPTAVHPGYGFLAENAGFAARAATPGSPSSAPRPRPSRHGQQDRRAPDRGRGRRARRARHRDPFPDDAATTRCWPPPTHRLSDRRQGGGGRRRQGHAGGRGPRVAAGAIRTARSEAGSAFGDSAVYLERQIIRPRHIEIQLLGDQHGTVIPFVERECSIQRRHQKVVEESPSLACDAGSAAADGARGRAVARAVGYTNAGTIEFLLDAGRLVLLPRDEHAAAGRASRHRDGHQPRPRALADPHRARRAARHRSRARAHAARPRDRVPHLRGGSRPRLHAVAGAHPRHPSRIRAGDPRRRRRDGGVHGAGVLRLDDREAGRVGRRPIRGDRADARGRSRSTRCSASGRRSRSSCG
jgi:hypothetical protein